METSNRARFEAALAGREVERPVYAVYDWFVQNRPLDWPRFFGLGLGEINHATVVKHTWPHVEIVRSSCAHGSGATRQDTRWITDIGELHEWHLGEWRQEYLVKKPEDYRILARALSDATVAAAPEAYAESERRVGDNGITLAVPELRRTAFQKIQIDFAGLERFSLDVAAGEPALMELIELMNDLTYREFERMAGLDGVRYIKLWENLTIETMGPALYRRHLVPVYRRLLDILAKSGQRLVVHYDGKLRIVAPDIRDLALDGIDSLTPPPEGDMSVAEARAWWPDKFLWLHPCLGWYAGAGDALAAGVRGMVRDAGRRRFCLTISEEVPAHPEETIPRVLEAIVAG